MKNCPMATALILLGLTAAPLHADCQRPAPVADLPDGATATKVEMEKGKSQILDYLTSLERYMDCMDSEIDEENPDRTVEQLQAQLQERDSAVDAMEAAAAAFNVELREYKSRDQ